MYARLAHLDQARRPPGFGLSLFLCGINERVHGKWRRERGPRTSNIQRAIGKGSDFRYQTSGAFVKTSPKAFVSGPRARAAWPAEIRHQVSESVTGEW